jgi:hypothetical protein
MNYGNGFYGVLEANYAFAICHFVSAAFGADPWHKPLATLAPFLPDVVGKLELVMALFCLAMLFIGGQVLGQAVNVFRGGSHRMDSRERGHKELGHLNAVKHLLYLLLFFSLAYLYLQQDHSGSRFKGRVLLETVAVCYAQIATQVIIAHMAKDAYVPAVTPYVALTVGIVNARVGLVPGETMACIIGAAALAGYLHFVVCVCNQVAGYLGITCLVITPKEES